MDAELTAKAREWIASIRETKTASARAAQLRKHMKALRGETNRLMQQRELASIQVDGFTISMHQMAEAKQDV